MTQGVRWPRKEHASAEAAQDETKVPDQVETERGVRASIPHKPMIRTVAIGLAIAGLVFLITAGHVIFLPLLFLPVGLFGFGHRRRHRRYW